jgi:hypothetical protein
MIGNDCSSEAIEDLDENNVDLAPPARGFAFGEDVKIQARDPSIEDRGEWQ